MLNPIPGAMQPDEVWYNFCHSSTRFFVEETFGRWKNRFRFLLRESHLSHKLASILIYVSMILHNLCTIRKDDAVDFCEGTDEEWQELYDNFKQMACPSCKLKRAMHCPHVPKWAANASNVTEGACAVEKRESLKRSLWEALNEDDTAIEELARMKARSQAAQAL